MHFKIFKKIVKMCTFWGVLGVLLAEACWVLCALPRAHETVLGAVPGGSWALFGSVLGRPGLQLGAKLAPKTAPEAHKNDLESALHFRSPLKHFFSEFPRISTPNMGPCWHPRGKEIRGQLENSDMHLVQGFLASN